MNRNRVDRSPEDGSLRSVDNIHNRSYLKNILTAASYAAKGGLGKPPSTVFEMGSSDVLPTQAFSAYPAAKFGSSRLL